MLGSPQAAISLGGKIADDQSICGLISTATTSNVTSLQSPVDLAKSSYANICHRRSHWIDASSIARRQTFHFSLAGF